MADRRFPPLWLRRLADTNTLRVFGAFFAVVAVVVLAGLVWLWVFVATGRASTAPRRFPPPWSVEEQKVAQPAVKPAAPHPDQGKLRRKIRYPTL